VAFFVARVVGVFHLYLDGLAFVGGGQGVGFAGRAVNRLAITQPAIGDACIRYAVGVVDDVVTTGATMREVIRVLGGCDAVARCIRCG